MKTTSICPKCKGTGAYDITRTCSRCAGTGRRDHTAEAARKVEDHGYSVIRGEYDAAVAAGEMDYAKVVWAAITYVADADNLF